MAFLFDLKDLVDLMSIGTLLAYTLVAACVLVLRYQPEQPSVPYQMARSQDDGELDSISEGSSNYLTKAQDKLKLSDVLFPKNTDPSGQSGSIVNICTSVIGVLVCVFCIVAVQGEFQVWSVITMTVLAVICVLFSLVIWRQPESKTKLSFKVPLLPFLPVLSMFINVYLMMQLDRGTWMRFAIWMVIGLFIYFGYGIRNSTEATSASNATENDNSGKHIGKINEPPIPEKEAFLAHVNDGEEEEEDNDS